VKVGIIAEAEYIAQATGIELEAADCRYCKRAQAKAGRNCRTHREEARLAYVCSPVSETYWAS
jgi:hypothetical protein